jgi:flagellar P-ring protein precursor FlgI
MRKWLLVLAMLLGVTGSARAERIKDIVDIKGEQGNTLEGIGLVTGLSGTGDSSTLSQRFAANYLRRQGLSVTIAELASKNIAVVMVKAELGPWARRGSKIDVTVSALGSATSLYGGQLHEAELKGPDGQVYALAEGAITVGGYAATGAAATVSKNHPTVGRIARGATVQNEELATIVENGEITLLLRNPDFTTATNIAKAVNAIFPKSSFAPDPGSIRVKIPRSVKRERIAEFIDRIGEQQVEVDLPARVIINERTGTIIVGEKVGISTVAISRGNLSIIIEEKDFISQPLPFSRTGTTARTERTDITIAEEKSPMVVIGRKPSVSDLARALNAMGLTTGDIISVFEDLKAQGALQAELRCR